MLRSGQDREAEPRFNSGAAGGAGVGRGGFGHGGPMGFQGGHGGYGGMGGGNDRQLYISNVCSFPKKVVPPSLEPLLIMSQLPYTVGWQDLKDLFRQAGTVEIHSLECQVLLTAG